LFLSFWASNPKGIPFQRNPSDREKKEKPRKTGKSLLQQLKNMGFSSNLFNSGTSIRRLRGRKAKAQNLLQRSIVLDGFRWFQVVSGGCRWFQVVAGNVDALTFSNLEQSETNCPEGRVGWF
jgi:hypothetical protein